MKRHPLLFVLVAVALLAVVLPASAQEQPGPQVRVKLGIIDMDAIARHAAVTKDVRAQVTAYRNAIREEIQKEEEELRKARDELARQRVILSSEAFEAERRKFEERLAGIGTIVQSRRQALQRVQEDAMAQVQRTLNEVVTDVAESHELTLILRTNQMVFWAKQLEITHLVLEALDERLPSLKVPEPSK